METKLCIACKKELPVEAFYPRKLVKETHTSRWSSRCKACRLAQSKDYWKKNIVRHRAVIKRRYDTYGRFAKYGLTAEQYDAMLVAQGNCCALCKADRPGGKGKWHIDHYGGTNRAVFNQCDASLVRGILCHRCNVSLGHYEKLVKRIGEPTIMEYLKE